MVTPKRGDKNGSAKEKEENQKGNRREMVGQGMTREKVRSNKVTDKSEERRDRPRDIHKEKKSI